MHVLNKLPDVGFKRPEMVIPATGHMVSTLTASASTRCVDWMIALETPFFHISVFQFYLWNSL